MIGPSLKEALIYVWYMAENTGEYDLLRNEFE